VGVLAVAIFPGTSSAHAALLKASPRAGSTVEGAVTEVRLAFSEEVVADLCHVALMTPAGAHVDLRVSSDPHDVRVIVAPFSRLAPGQYRVMWHVVSADGHPVSGEYGFIVAAPATGTVAAAPPIATSEDSAELEGEQNAYPFAAALARGAGVFALLSLAGILAFAGGRPGDEVAAFSLARGLAVLAGFSLLVHLFLWDRYVLPGGMFTSASSAAMLTSPPGRLELLRVVAALLALALVLARVRARFTAFVAAAGVVITGMIGHPASTLPVLSIPITVIHLAAVSLWVGGVFSLLAERSAEPASFRAHAVRVSRVALAAFVVTAITGAVQSALLLTSPADLVATGYGRLILAKIVGLLLLGAFGAYHRFRAVPALAGDGRHRMTVSLRNEMMVMALVIIIAAFLSYTPLPR
jgi:copper transport protein